MSKQFKEELKTVDRIKSNLVINEIDVKRNDFRVDSDELEEIEERLRDEINKKMEICVKLINNNTHNNDKGITDRIN